MSYYFHKSSTLNNSESNVGLRLKAAHFLNLYVYRGRLQQQRTDTLLSSFVRVIINAEDCVLWFKLRYFSRFVVLPRLLSILFVHAQTSQSLS